MSEPIDEDRPYEAVPINVPGWGQAGCPNFCSKSQALELLEKAQGCSSGFRGFSTFELRNIVEYASFIKPRVGMDVVCKGERSTFFVLVLAGAVEVVNALESSGKGNKILIQKGDLLGELSLFMARPALTKPHQLPALPAIPCSFVWNPTRQSFSRIHAATWAAMGCSPLVRHEHHR